MIKIKFLAITTVFFLTTITVMAQTAATDDDPKKVNFAIGAGAGFTPQYEGSNDILAIPALTFAANWTSGQYIRLSGLGIEANILSNNKWEFGPKLRFKLPRNEDIVDNDMVASLEEIDVSAMAGLFTRYKFGKGFDVKAEFTQDVSGVSEGGVAGLELGYTFRKHRFLTRFSANTTFATENYMDTYFGVNPENLNSSLLSFYDLDGGIKDIGATINTTYFINSKWALSGQIGYNQLLGEVADSPVVENGNSTQLSGGIIAIFRF